MYSISAILAGVFWGCISLFLKSLSAAGMSSITVMACRAFFSSIILLLFILIKDRSLLKIHLTDIWLFLGTGVISLTFFSLCYFTTILEVGASVAVILLYTSPIFVLLLSVFFFHEKISLQKIIALLMTFAGCIFVAGLGSASSGTRLSAKGFLIGICAGLGYALYSIFSRFALRKYSSITVSFYTFVFSAISLLPFIHFNEFKLLASPKLALFAAGISLFCTVLPYALYTFSLSGLETGRAAILVTVEPLVGTMIGLLVWKEAFSVQKLAGIVLIFAAVIMLNIPFGKNRKSAA
ncbi:MAG: DMT family transporter [Treponema sp.]|nr:DMT family transporter [Treponema sp.]